MAERGKRAHGGVTPHGRDAVARTAVGERGNRAIWATTHHRVLPPARTVQRSEARLRGVKAMGSNKLLKMRLQLDLVLLEGRVLF